MSRSDRVVSVSETAAERSRALKSENKISEGKSNIFGLTSTYTSRLGLADLKDGSRFGSDEAARHDHLGSHQLGILLLS